MWRDKVSDTRPSPLATVAPRHQPPCFAYAVSNPGADPDLVARDGADILDP